MVIESILKFVGSPLVAWALVFLFAVVIPLVKYFGRRKLERGPESKNLELLEKETQIVRERLKLAKEFTPQLTEDALNAIRQDPTQVVVRLRESIPKASSPEVTRQLDEVYENILALFFVVCIHSGSESDLISTSEKIWFPVVKEITGFDMMAALKDNPEAWANRRELARRTFWMSYDLLKNAGYDFKHWQNQIDVFANEIPRLAATETEPTDAVEP